jgi:hypothetical protein
LTRREALREVVHFNDIGGQITPKTAAGDPAAGAGTVRLIIAKTIVEQLAVVVL